MLPPQRDAHGVITTTGLPGKTVALTFDDGPSTVYTPQVLDVLDAHGVTAIFCVVGSAAQAHPEIIEDIVNRGHALCDHTISHDLKLSTRDEQRIRDEIRGDPGPNPRGNARDRGPVLAGPGRLPVGRSTRWRRPTTRNRSGRASIRRTGGSPAPTIYAAVTAGVTPGSIVLLHDGGGDQSDTVAGDIISALDDASYEFVIPQP